MLEGDRMHTGTSRIVPVALMTILMGCGARSSSPEAGQSTLTAACPCTQSREGGAAAYEPSGRGPMMGGAMMGPGGMGAGGMGQGRDGMMQGGMAAQGGPLTPDAKSALFRALDDEYRAEALYAHISSRLGSPPPLALVSRAEHRHAWVLESLVLAHGLELPPNRWSTAKQPDAADMAAACRAGVDSERKTIASYDELLKVDLPADLRRAFAGLRAASAERHLPAFQSCR